MESAVFFAHLPSLKNGAWTDSTGILQLSDRISDIVGAVGVDAVVHHQFNAVVSGLGRQVEASVQTIRI